MDEVDQKVEDLRLDRNKLRTVPQLAAMDVKHMIGKGKRTRRLRERPRSSRDNQAVLKRKSSCGQSLPAQPAAWSATSSGVTKRAGMDAAAL